MVQGSIRWARARWVTSSITTTAYMSVEIMAAERVPYQQPDAFGGTPQERSEAISTYLSYAGLFEVLPHRDTVIHHIEVCSYPNWIGNGQVRFAKREETCWCSAPSR
jgi:Lipocalin-like domain